MAWSAHSFEACTWGGLCWYEGTFGWVKFCSFSSKAQTERVRGGSASKWFLQGKALVPQRLPVRLHSQFPPPPNKDWVFHTWNIETFQIKTACVLRYFSGPRLLPTCQPLASPHHWLSSACLAMANPCRPSGGSTWLKLSFSALAAPRLWMRLCCLQWDGMNGYCRRTEQLKTEKDQEIYDQWVEGKFSCLLVVISMSFTIWILFCLFLDWVSSSSGWPWTPCVAKAGLKFLSLLPPLPEHWELRSYATTPSNLSTTFKPLFVFNLRLGSL